MARSNLLAFIALATSTATVTAQHQHGDEILHGTEHAAIQQELSPAPSDSKSTNPDDEEAGPHGGTMQALGSMQVETVVEQGGMRLYVYNEQGEPVELKRARGLATLQAAGDAKRYRYDLFPEIEQDQSAESIAVAVDLSRLAGREVTVAYQLVGIAGSERRPAKFISVATVPMTEAQKTAAAIEAQGVCPVSGQPLGGMGKPVPVTIGEQTVYVCCAGCIDAVKGNPAKYLGLKPVLKLAKSTAADADAIARQKLCPVMDEPLGSMGTPLKVTGLERDVYLCCKGCFKFVEKEPEKYLAKLPPLPKAEVVKATDRDAPFVAVQKLCPVMDEPLDAMGGPYRTVVEGRVVYLCCPGCAKKLHASPKDYLQKLAGQGVQPPAVR